MAFLAGLSTGLITAALAVWGWREFQPIPPDAFDEPPYLAGELERDWEGQAFDHEARQACDLGTCGCLECRHV